MDIDISIDPQETSIVIKDFIKTYVKNSKVNGLVVGLSGGIDSAVTALFCKEAIGIKKVKCIFLPEKTTPKNDYKHCELIAKKFNLTLEKIDITDIVEKISLKSLKKPDKYTLANIKARTRMIFLYEYANMTNSLVCWTSNKSEILVGYFTKYGDGGIDLMPIGDVYKTQVYRLAKYLKIPSDIIKKPPTAGLWKEQSDEKELKINYEKLDLILAGLERKMDIDDIADFVKVKKAEVNRIKNMRINSEHKRRAALIPKVGLRTPGYDWRSPILKG